MAEEQTKDTNVFACATASQRTLKDLRVRQQGQPVCAIGHLEGRKGTEAVFEHFNHRLAMVKFSDGKLLGYDPSELLLPCEIHEDGEAYFEIRQCKTCDQTFALTADEFWAEEERAECPECSP